MRRKGHSFFLTSGLVTVISVFLLTSVSVAKVKPIKVGTYKQEVCTIYTSNDGLPADSVNVVALGPGGTVYAGTDKGLAVFENSAWTRHPRISDSVSALAVDGDTVFVVHGGSLEVIAGQNVRKLATLSKANVNDLAAKGQNAWAATDSGLLTINGARVTPDKALNALLGDAKAVFQVAVSRGGSIAVAADSGLFLSEKGGKWETLFPFDDKGRSWAPRGVRGVAFDDRDRLWFASPQGAGMLDGQWTLFTGRDGLPYNDFTMMCSGEKGVVWFGTQIGAIRYDGDEWAYRQGRCWLPDDVVRDIAVTDNGDAWFATSNGVGVIERRPMTLAEKAEFYEQEIEKYIARTEYGYLSEVGLKNPGDKSEILYSDSDNDGLWTSMYGAGECFAYAATKDPKAKARAKKAFEALRFLSIAPVGGEVKQQPGYVARTVLPTTEPDPNKREGHTLEGQRRNRERSDALWKVYTPRWPLTADKKYWYKTDTSSDELDGHYFFYPAYYDLVADTKEEKERVCEVVRTITDHLLRNDFNLVDHDGTPTRWAIYSPKSLNHDHMWWSERGLKSLSILSYLTVAEHMTGDPKYTKAIAMLREQHAFDTNAMVTKIQHGAGSGNQSDDEMAVMGYYNLIKYTKDEELRKEMVYSFFNYWVLDAREMNPFFNFAYAASSEGIQYTNPWGTFELKPWDGWLEDSVKTLTGFPLDRLNWAHHNSHRLDIELLRPPASSEPYEAPRRNLGYRVTNGKVLPIQERHFNHWNTNPWALDYGGNGRQLASGTVFLLPYYMGLYHGYIE